MSEPQGLLLEAVSELATMAGRVALTHFGKELRVETKTDGSPVTLADRAAEVAAMVRSWGDSYGYFLVATGRAEVMVDPVLADWDTAALLPIVVEAGGVFTDWRGRATAFGKSAIATNAAVAAEARGLLDGGG